MPYVITTTPAGPPAGSSSFAKGAASPFAPTRRAVATLGEAREAAAAECKSRPYDTVNPVNVALALPKAGGKIGPLPDGTVIEVAEVDYVQLRARAGIPFDDRFGDKIIAAYNAMQEA